MAFNYGRHWATTEGLRASSHYQVPWALRCRKFCIVTETFFSDQTAVPKLACTSESLGGLLGAALCLKAPLTICRKV